MLLIVERPQFAPMRLHDGTPYMWVTTLPKTCHCAVFRWRCSHNGDYYWEWRGQHVLLENMSWRQLVASMPDMSSDYRDDYVDNYYLFVHPNQLAAALR